MMMRSDMYRVMHLERVYCIPNFPDRKFVVRT